MGNFANQQVTIRPVTQADLAAVRHVLVTTWHATYDAILGNQQVEAITAAWHCMEALEQQRLAPGLSFLVAEVDRRVVATASARSGTDGRISLSRLYVLPEMQGRGIGRQLLAAGLAAFPRVRTRNSRSSSTTRAPSPFTSAQGSRWWARATIVPAAARASVTLSWRNA